MNALHKILLIVSLLYGHVTLAEPIPLRGAVRGVIYDVSRMRFDIIFRKDEGYRVVYENPAVDGLKFAQYFEILLNHPELVERDEAPQFTAGTGDPSGEAAVNSAWQVLHNSLRFILGLRPAGDDVFSLNYPVHIIYYTESLSGDQAKRRDEIKELYRRKVLGLRDINFYQFLSLVSSLIPQGTNPPPLSADPEVRNWAKVNVEHMINSGQLTNDQQLAVIRILLELLPTDDSASNSRPN